MLLKKTQLYAALSSTPILFHMTGIGAAVKIFKSGKFELKPSHGTDAETSLSKSPYYLSTSRSKLGAFSISKLRDTSAIFVLDGTRLGNSYKILPVDYWGGSGLTPDQRTRMDEAEDRVLSKTPTIPAMKYVKEVHAHIGPMAQELKRLCLRRSIPLFLYDSERSLLLMNKLRSVALPLGPLPAPSDSAYKPSDSYVAIQQKKRRKNVIAGWLALYHVKLPADAASAREVQSRLGEYAKYCLNRLSYVSNGDALRQLNADMHNAKSQEYEAITGERKNLDSLVAILSRRQWSTNDLVMYLHEKWKL